MGVYCKACLREWFLVATKSLSDMPGGRCCGLDIALFPGSLGGLSKEEVSKYHGFNQVPPEPHAHLYLPYTEDGFTENAVRCPSRGMDHDETSVLPQPDMLGLYPRPPLRQAAS